MGDGFDGSNDGGRLDLGGLDLDGVASILDGNPDAAGGGDAGGDGGATEDGQETVGLDETVTEATDGAASAKAEQQRGDSADGSGKKVGEDDADDADVPEDFRKWRKVLTERAQKQAEDRKSIESLAKQVQESMRKLEAREAALEALQAGRRPKDEEEDLFDFEDDDDDRGRSGRRGSSDPMEQRLEKLERLLEAQAKRESEAADRARREAAEKAFVDEIEAVASAHGIADPEVLEGFMDRHPEWTPEAAAQWIRKNKPYLLKRTPKDGNNANGRRTTLPAAGTPRGTPGQSGKLSEIGSSEERRALAEILNSGE